MSSAKSVQTGDSMSPKVQYNAVPPTLSKTVAMNSKTSKIQEPPPTSSWSKLSSISISDSTKSLSNYRRRFPQNWNKKFYNLYENTKDWLAKAILRKENGARRIRLPNFRLYDKVVVSKIEWYWNKNRNIDQQNQTESPKNKPLHLWSINLWQRRQEYTME